jgi:tryptophan 2,3-dioxygenase
MDEPDASDPVLPGTGASDYKRSCARMPSWPSKTGPDDWVHRDELLFHVVHQSSELWLKLAAAELEEATRLIERGELTPALRLLRRCVLCLRYLTDQLEMLEQMSPWEYHTVRKELGHGSTFDSSGFRRVHTLTPALGRAFTTVLAGAGLDLEELYRHDREHEELFALAELLIEWEERISVWRFRHYKVISRIIGADVVGTQVTPVEVLGRLIHQTYFPQLWTLRSQLTELSNDGPLSTRSGARAGSAPDGSEGGAPPLY